MLSFKTQVGKVKTSQTTCEFTLISLYFKLQIFEFKQLIDDIAIDL